MKWQDYFQYYEGYFWQWEEEGTVLTIPNSSTIAYTEFVAELLQLLADQGLPPFGSLLLSVIATNPDGEKSLDVVYSLMDIKLGTDNGTREPLKSAISFLKLLSQLPKKYKTGRNRLLLLQTLLANCHNSISAAKSKNILDYFTYNLQNHEKLFLVKSSRYIKYHNDFRVISLLAGKFPDIQTIIAKLADLPFIEEDIKLDEPATEAGQTTEKDFIQELISHNQTFHVGSLIRRLWSSLQIPYHHALPSRQPLGGVSDLSNKGEFDRLLLSEFANDDFVFLSRLANNEALYINREVPPHNNQLERVILIDVSIKNWGTPKTVAYALLLAIARHPKTDIHCSAFTVGNTYHQFSFGTIDEVITSLQVLEPCLHPALGLEAWFREYGTGKDKEVFFISSAEVYDQPQLRKTLSDHQSSFNYLVQTDNTGNIDLYKKQQNSKKHVQHIQLDLEEQWKKEPKQSPAKADDKKGKKTVYPILFPGPANPKNLLLGEDGALYLLTAERALLRSVDHGSVHKKGWEMICENLPLTNGDAEIGIRKDGTYMLLLFNVSNRKLIIFNLTTGKSSSVHFNEWRQSEYKNFIFKNDQFIYSYLGYPSKHWLFTLEEEIVVRPIENIPKAITDNHNFREQELKKLNYKNRDQSVLKNVTAVYINEVGNLVFNIHELRLTDQSVIKLDKTGFLKKEITATASGKDEFYFPDGSLVTINRSGMLILKSSEPSIRVVYVPLVLDADLGAASGSFVTGNYYYYPEGAAKKEPVSRREFWKQYIEPFIANIKSHGAYIKTTS